MTMSYQHLCLSERCRRCPQSISFDLRRRRAASFVVFVSTGAAVIDIVIDVVVVVVVILAFPPPVMFSNLQFRLFAISVLDIR